MESQLSAAQADIETALRGLDGSDAVSLARGSEQLQLLARLQRALAGGEGTNDLSFRSAVASAVAESTAIVSAGRDAASTAKGAQSAAAAEIDAQTRRQVESVSRDYYESRIFDPHLKFTSAEEEAEFRRREADAKRYVDAELAKSTPEGNLNAGGGMQAQLIDAAANGAADSPDFMARWEELAESVRKQREELRAEGKPTDEYDKRIEESVRHFLRSKGKTDQEIDAIIAASGGDPVAAVKPYLQDEKDGQELERSVERSDNKGTVDASAKPEAEAVAAPSQDTVTAGVDDIFAQFKATGMTHTSQDCPPPGDTDHGLAGKGCKSPIGPDRSPS